MQPIVFITLKTCVDTYAPEGGLGEGKLNKRNVLIFNLNNLALNSHFSSLNILLTARGVSKRCDML
jgi:hypothetical protein